MSQALQELEQEILRFFIEKPELSKTYIPLLNESDFEFDHTREIFSAIEERVTKGEKYDRTLILSDVSQNRDAASVLRYASAIADEDIKVYVTKLRDVSSKRKIRDYLIESQEVLKKKGTAYEFSSKSIDFFRDILDGTATGTDRSVPLAEYVPVHRALMDEARKGVPLGITTGMDLLDDYMAGGLKKGDFILIGARPSVGKTSLALTFAFNAAKAGAKVLFISVEMRTKDVFDRLLAFNSGKPLTDIIRGEVDVEKDYADLAKLGIRVVEAPKCTSKDVISIATREKYVNGVDLVVVDYLQYLSDTAKGQTDSVRVGKISRNLKSLAGTLDVPVVAPAQLSRRPEQRTGAMRGIPSLEDLRDSGNLEQDADVVMLLHRDQDNPTQASMRIAKNRKGETGSFDMVFNTKTTQYEMHYSTMLSGVLGNSKT